ncbi:MAG TPA: RluA family pseudouridine synthase [Candidatus Binataceae bacterium]|nr:RluA family pseudouridine synthase [Candidatus Binataceae bacterium]
MKRAEFHASEHPAGERAPQEERLDRHLVRLGFAPSRRAAREMVARGIVTINGRRCRKGQLVAATDQVAVTEEFRPPAIESNPRLALDVLYEDPNLLVINKPGLLPCHPLKPGERDTVMNAVVARYPETADAGDKPREGGLVHRLDNGTSGALIIARNRETFDTMRRAIKAHAIVRHYDALVEGVVDRTLELTAPIAHHPRNARKMTAVVAGALSGRRAGRRAITHVEPARRVGRYTLVSVTPETGSRHQIRVHLANAGHPIVGDSLYSGPRDERLDAGRFWLHLREVAFESSRAGRITVRAPLPPDLSDCLH